MEKGRQQKKKKNWMGETGRGGEEGWKSAEAQKIIKLGGHMNHS